MAKVGLTIRAVALRLNRGPLQRILSGSVLKTRTWADWGRGFVRADAYRAFTCKGEADRVQSGAECSLTIDIGDPTLTGLNGSGGGV